MLTCPLFHRPVDHGVPFLPEGDPHPEPRDHLDEYKGEEDPVLETVAAPGGGVVGGIVSAGVGDAAAGGAGRVEGRRRARQEGVGYEAEGEDEAEGRCRR